MALDTAPTAVGGLSRATASTGETLVCADPKTERLAQTVRLGAGLVGGPFVVYLGMQTSGGLKTAGVVAGLACSVWNLWAWNEVRKIQKQGAVTVLPRSYK